MAVAPYRDSTKPEGIAYADKVLTDCVRQGGAFAIPIDKNTGKISWFWYRGKRYEMVPPWIDGNGSSRIGGAFDLSHPLGKHFSPTTPMLQQGWDSHLIPPSQTQENFDVLLSRNGKSGGPCSPCGTMQSTAAPQPTVTAAPSPAPMLTSESAPQPVEAAPRFPWWLLLLLLAAMEE